MNRSNLYHYATGEAYQGQQPSETFTDIFKRRDWDVTTSESVSGEGSSLEQTKVLVRELPGIFRQLGVRSLLDLPCGDFNWMRLVNLEGIEYTGGDIVADIIAQNQERFASPQRKFLKINLLEDNLPACDLLLCRDCLVHLSFEHIQQALANIRRSPVRYLMTTHFPEELDNQDIITGGWRPLHFCLEPFHFPPPLLLLNEGCTEMGGAFADKCLAVWENPTHF